ncbi:hypothetical protein T07_9710 [Trichinella nelsoni]|uniref:Uncharacterized protein n=1 Tax=Trichinella nelsoni TaxID=6336 RepID=A0A0V0RFF2_9BILA|nr:hypothetical protein T07_9710 [Trichinella nelsoni]
MKIGGGVPYRLFTSVLASCQKRVRVYIVVDPVPSGKRETERKGNAPVNTGPSPNSDGRVNNPVEEADEPARGSGPLQYFIQQYKL